MANGERFEKQLASKVMLRVGVEKDDGELGWWCLQMMPDLTSQRWLAVKILADFLEREE